MRETSLEIASADTTAATPTPTIRKRRCTSTSLYPTPTHLAPRLGFWTARIRKIPSFRCNPWDFYEPFLKFGSRPSLVLCNDKTEIRVIRIFNIASEDEHEYESEDNPGGKKWFPLLEIKHPNFINIWECYLFKDEIFVFTEYIGFSIRDILHRSIHPTEREIAYIISQVSRISPLPQPTIVNIAGLGWRTIHLVQGTRPPTYINKQYSCVFERRDQDW